MIRHDLTNGIVVTGNSLDELTDKWLDAKNNPEGVHQLKRRIGSRKVYNKKTGQHFDTIMELSGYLGVNYGWLCR